MQEFSIIEREYMKSLIIVVILLAAGLTGSRTASAQCENGVCRAGLGGGKLIHRERTRERSGIARRVVSVLPAVVVFRTIRERRGCR